MSTKVIKGGTIVTADLTYKADIKIEGGRIELKYSDGGVIPIMSNFMDDRNLPASDGPLELTSVAADGTRGETLRVEEDAIEREAVYIPCSARGEGHGSGLWFLGPVFWIAAARGRRGSGR